MDDTTVEYDNLREANIHRQAEWVTDSSKTDLDWRLNELCGEVGEVCNVLKKIHRERCGIMGSRANVSDLADELADVVICVDLVLMELNHPAVALPRVWGFPKGDQVPLTRLGVNLFRRTSRLVLVTMTNPDTIDRVDLVGETAATVLISAAKTANAVDVDLWPAVVNKFNGTSVKQGLRTRLIAT